MRLFFDIAYFRMEKKNERIIRIPICITFVRLEDARIYRLLVLGTSPVCAKRAAYDLPE